MSMKEHRKAATIERTISHVEDEEFKQSKTLSKVTKDKIAMRRQNKMLGEVSNISKISSQCHSILRSKSKIETGQAII